jgi:two-component system, NarL family, nitrate/nitrite response regulator NarL
MRFLIASSSEIACKELRAILDCRVGWTVCGETGNGLKAVLLAHELRPDLIIVDLSMPMLDGIQAASEISKFLPFVPIVIYTRDVLPELDVNARQHGVWAMVSSAADQKQLIETLERLLPSGGKAGADVATNSSAPAQSSREPQLQSSSPAPPAQPEPA